MSTGDNPLTRNYHGYEVRPMDTEDLHEIGQANYAGPYTIDPVQSMPLSQLSGSAFRQDKVGPLADKIKANGWLEPIVVDGSGNIIEGQHRFRALQQLGVPDAPVHRIREAVSPDVYYSIRDAAASGQKMHQDHAGQIANQIAEIIGEEGPQALHEYEAPRGFEKGWAAAVQAAQKAHGLSTGDNPLMKSAPNPFDFSNPGGGTRTAQVGNTEITYGVGKNGDAELTLIKTPEGLRGQGSGRAAMQQFLNEADRNGYRVLLNADPMGKGVSKNKLVDFYKSFGFKRNAGNKRDFTTRAEFIRDPKSAE